MKLLEKLYWQCLFLYISSILLNREQVETTAHVVVYHPLVNNNMIVESLDSQRMGAGFQMVELSSRTACPRSTFCFQRSERNFSFRLNTVGSAPSTETETRKSPLSLG